MDYWRPTWIGDVDYIAATMREEDELEVAAQGHTPKQALLLGYKHSTVCRTLVSPTGEPIAMVGVVPHDDLGAIWLLGNSGIEECGYRFLRHSKAALDELYNETGLEAFYNYTHKDNIVHHKWLRWLGFKFLRRVTIGNSGFIEFCRLKKMGE